MKILFLPKYDTKGSSSRYRIYQFLKGFRKRGIQADVFPLLGNWYIDNIYSGKSKIDRRLVGSYLKRLQILGRAADYDLLYIEKELFPCLPAFFERRLRAKGVKFIVDYDDAVFHGYENVPFLWNKIPDVMALSTAVVAGNEYLATHAERYNPNVFTIPTVVDLSKYIPKDDYCLDGDTFVIGWIGSPATQHYLDSVAESLITLSREFKILLKCIGTRPDFAMEGVRVKNVPWSEDSEARELVEIDVGIMPLTDDPFSKGKCGLKLIQYMACGVPVVASPVGVNQTIVEEGKNGFFAANTGQWLEKMRIFASAEPVRFRMGSYGRSVVEDRYGLTMAERKLVHIFLQNADTK